MNTRSEFLNRPSIRGLPKAEKERRWKQHASAQASPRVAPPARRSSPSRGGPKLPDCSVDYALALAQPFAAEGACLPYIPAIPSRKTKVFARGTATIGLGGYGWVLIRRRPDNNGGTLAYTTGAYAGTSTTSMSHLDAGVSIGTHNGDYNSVDFTQLGSPLSARVVAGGVRVRYIGTELNRSGQILAFEHPDHHNLDAEFSWNDIGKYDRAQYVAPSEARDWVATTWQPVRATDFNYHNGVSDAPFQDWTQAIMFSGVPGEQYFFEYVTHFEYVGDQVRGKTANRSEQDITGKTVSLMGTIATKTYDALSNMALPAAKAWVTKSLQNYLVSGSTQVPLLMGAAGRMALTM